METNRPKITESPSIADFRIAEFKCTNFRSYAVADIQLGPKLNCLIGPNGAGKTNILDAMYYLALCRSPLNLKDSRSIRHGESAFALFGRFRGASTPLFSVALAYSEGKTKEVQIDGTPLERLADHIGRVPLIASYPCDTNIIDDGGELKRRFLNAAIAQYDRQHIIDLLKYDRLLRQRNAYLKEGSPDDGLLEVLNAQLDECATPIFKARNGFCNDIKPLLQEFYLRLTDSREAVDIAYKSQLQKGNFLQLLRDAKGSDLQLQHSTVGIHRDNLDLLLDGFPIRAEGSQGQRRSYMIALRLAQLQLLANKIKIAPILLLDDLFDRLDPMRTARLIAIVLAPPFQQVILTDTQSERLAETLDYDTEEHQFFNVENGIIAPAAI